MRQIPVFTLYRRGYGLPWGTEEEENIPAPLLFEAEMALAKEQLKSQTPNCGLQEEQQNRKLDHARVAENAPEQNDGQTEPAEIGHIGARSQKKKRRAGHICFRTVDLGRICPN